MSLTGRLLALWTELRGFSPPLHPDHPSTPLESPDLPELIAQEPDRPDDAPPTWQAESITGRHALIIYSDSRNRETERQIVCRRIEEHNGQHHLMALCLLRSQIRQFRLDRIRQFVDCSTGEIFEPGEDLLHHYAPAFASKSPFHYGLSPRQFADFNAALNVLAFIARCDGVFDDVEADAIADFAVALWMRAEFDASLDLDQVTRHARSLNPDPESLWVSLDHCMRNRVIASILPQHIAAVIDADGVQHSQEIYWANEIAAVLASRSE
jgi:hypothetical protein